MMRVRGFSLIELLIVIVIIALAAGVGVANFRDFSRRQDVDNFARILVGDLRTAQTNASGGRIITGCTGQFLGYQVSFTASAVAGGGRSTSYSLIAACQTTSATVKTVTLPTGVFLTINRTPTAGVITILFHPLEMGTDIPQGNQVTLTVANSPTTARTQDITISSTGEIQLQ